MKLDTLAIDNFGIYQKAHLDFGDDYCHVIMGPSESGKTTIFNAIRRSLGLKLDGIIKGDDKNLVHRGARTGQIELAFTRDGVQHLVRWTPSRAMTQAEILAAHGLEEKVLHACLAPNRWLLLKPSERMELVNTVTGTGITVAVLEQEGIKDSELIAKVLTKGIDAGFEMIRKKQNRLSGQVVSYEKLAPPEDSTFTFPKGTRKISDMPLQLIEQGLSQARKIESTLIAAQGSDPKLKSEIEGQIKQYEKAIKGVSRPALDSELASVRDARDVATKTRDEIGSNLSTERLNLTRHREAMQSSQSEIERLKQGTLLCDGRFASEQDNVCPKPCDGMLERLQKKASDAEAGAKQSESAVKSLEDQHRQAQAAADDLQKQVDELNQKIAAFNANDNQLAILRSRLLQVEEASTPDVAKKIENCQTQIRLLTECHEARMLFDERLRLYNDAADEIRDLVHASLACGCDKDALVKIQSAFADDPIEQFLGELRAIAAEVIPGHDVGITRDLDILVDGMNWRSPALSAAAQTAFDTACRMALCRIAGCRLLIIDNLNDFDEQRRVRFLGAVLKYNHMTNGPFETILVGNATTKGGKLNAPGVASWITDGTGGIQRL